MRFMGTGPLLLTGRCVGAGLAMLRGHELPGDGAAIAAAGQSAFARRLPNSGPGVRLALATIHVLAGLRASVVSALARHDAYPYRVRKGVTILQRLFPTWEGTMTIARVEYRV